MTPRYKVDKRALEEACRMLGIIHPVTIRRCYMRYAWGHHFTRWFRETGMIQRHHISLCSSAGVKLASETLWHELCHAEQAERMGPEAYERAYRAERLACTGRRSNQAAARYASTEAYYTNRFEREALQHEDLAGVFPLCVPA